MNLKLDEEAKTILFNAIKIEYENINADCSIDNTPSWDSLAHIKLILEIEEKYNIELNPEQIQNITDYNTVCSTIKGLTKNK